MSVSEKKLANSTLRKLVEKVGKHNPEPAGRLWAQAAQSADYQCLVKHSVLHRQRAIERLIELNPGEDMTQLSAHEDIFPYVSSGETRVRIGQIILSATCEGAVRCYHKVAEYVPELRAEAVEGIVRGGAWWYDDLNAVWRWGDASVRDAVWAKMLNGERSHHQQIFNHLMYIMFHGVEDLPERAWSAFKEEGAPDDYAFDTSVGTLLDHPDFDDRVWEWLKGFGCSEARLIKVMKGYPRFADEALQMYADNCEEKNKAFDLWRILGLEDDYQAHRVSAHLAEIQRKAADLSLIHISEPTRPY
jgi:hypothetical protein